MTRSLRNIRGIIRHAGPLMLMLAVALAVPRAASAATLTIGSLSVGNTIDYQIHPYYGTLHPYAGSASYVTNTSPVAFLDVTLRVMFYDVGFSDAYVWDCEHLGVAAGATERCTTGPLEPAPQVVWGIAIGGAVTGTLAATSFLLPDGNTFLANSPFFSVPQFFHMFRVDHQTTLDDLTRPIQIEGTVVPATTPPTVVPEPATLTLVLGGASMLGLRARRRTTR